MIKKLYRFLFKIILWFLVVSTGFVVLFKWVPIPITPLMGIRYFEKTEKKIWKHHWKSIDNISRKLQLAVVSSEDQKFLHHNGFDVKAIEKAYINNQKGKKIRGASTISQQTAKNVFLWPERSWLRKGLETYFTFLIEQIWTKKRIMEVYLNSIEMGPGIYGAEAAAQYWFKKPANKLTKEEAAAIAAILPKPLAYKANPRTLYLESRKQWILRQMQYIGTIDYKTKDNE